ncbi:maleylpyruvate isomerase family mycothiol-dependent enzyme [Actinomadura chokoriensis]|uniref:Maleylpyruvate isomerase family mycothiol-dependent enzyme n=1 Tax=Actinomadura chokoriensis TaxID=454156 RepID=A0ABV4R4B0_9ACTN
MEHERLCDEIVTQTELLTSSIRDGDMTAPVPSCPGWNVGQLLRHLGGGQRWAEEIVRTRAAAPPPDDHFRDLSGYADENAAVVGPWLRDGAGRLAATLRQTGPDADVWTPVPGRTASFYARRFAHETLIHRADAMLALGREFTVADDVAADALDEWMELGSLPMMLDLKPEQRDLLGPGRSVHLHATDTPAEWLVDLTGDVIAWRRVHEKAAVAVRGTLTELLLLVYRRRPVGGLEVFGDAQLLDFWLERVGFG